MRKCILTYILVLFFSLLYTTSIGAVKQFVRFTAARGFNIKSTTVLADSPLQHDTQETFARYTGSMLLSLIHVHFIPGNILFMYFPGLYTGKISGASVIKHNLKDYLLHLFPSHYFW